MLPTIVRRVGDRGLDRPLSVFNELDRLLNRSWDDTGEITAAYPVDIHEDDQAIYVDAELPGFGKDEIEVNLEKGVLRITAERKKQPEKGQAHLTERRYTRVARAFTLPTGVDDNKVDATLKDGVLHLKLDKREEVKPRRITVK